MLIFPKFHKMIIAYAKESFFPRNWEILYTTYHNYRHKKIMCKKIFSADNSTMIRMQSNADSGMNHM